MTCKKCLNKFGFGPWATKKYKVMNAPAYLVIYLESNNDDFADDKLSIPQIETNLQDFIIEKTITYQFLSSFLNRKCNIQDPIA